MKFSKVKLRTFMFRRSLPKTVGASLLLFVLFSILFMTHTHAASSWPQIKPNTRFAWNLQSAPSETALDNQSGPKVYDFDFLNSNAAQIARIKAKGVDVVCYFSAGTDEDWTPDHDQFKAGDTFGKLPGWEGEQVVDTRSTNVRSIMYNRIQTMHNLGCNGIDPDNVDAYTNIKSPLTATTALNYMQFLSDTAHNFHMSIALKNSGNLVNQKLPDGQTVVQAYDYAIVEQCYQYKECDLYKPFVDVGKAVTILEYKGTASTWATSADCKDADAKNYDAYLTSLSLNGGPSTACRTGGPTGPVTPPANISPKVTLQSLPLASAAPATFTLSAAASDQDGSISRVEFYQGTTKLGEDTTAPYTFTAANYQPGNYTFSAVAYDNKSASTESNSVSVAVNKPTPTPPPRGNAPVWPANANVESGFNTNWWSKHCGSRSTCVVYVKWPFASDDAGIKGYQVWRAVDSQPAVEMNVNSSRDQFFTDRIDKNSRFTYSVFAVDKDGNRSAALSTSLKINCSSTCSLQ